MPEKVPLLRLDGYPLMAVTPHAVPGLLQHFSSLPLSQAVGSSPTPRVRSPFLIEALSPENV